MSWQIVVLLRIAGASIIGPIAMKRLGDVELRELAHRIFWMYVWALCFALGVALLYGFTPSQDLVQIFMIGALMPLGVAFQWRANAKSVSRTALFSESSVVIPLFLSAFVRGEWRELAGNEWLIAGFGMVALGLGLHAYSDIKKKRQGEVDGTSVPLTFYGNALGFTAVFALATYLENVWAKSGIAAPEFLTSWYTGAFAGAAVLFLATRHLSREPIKESMSKPKKHIYIFLLAVSAVLGLGLQFIAFTQVEQVIALPAISAGALICPAVIGVLFLKEHYSSWSLVYYVLAFVGALVMALAH